MKKYRIKEYIRADGGSFFEVQQRILFFWFSYDMWTSHCKTMKEAEDIIAEMQGREIIKTKIHE